MHKKTLFFVYITQRITKINNKTKSWTDQNKVFKNQMVWMQDFYRMIRAESRFDTKREKTENWDDHETQRTI